MDRSKISTFFFRPRIKQKYKGEFGDPYQNSIGVEVTRKLKNKKINIETKRFLEGYVDYLGKDFLYSYGRYSYSNIRKTMAFDYFFQMTEQRTSKGLKKEILLRIKRKLIGYQV